MIAVLNAGHRYQGKEGRSRPLSDAPRLRARPNNAGALRIGLALGAIGKHHAEALLGISVNTFETV